MALNWYWENKCGECIIESNTAHIDLENNEVHDTCTLNLYEGNAYLIFIHEFEQDGKNMYNLWTFWSDKTHMKRCLGLDKNWKETYGKNIYKDGYSNIRKIRLNKAKCRHYKDIVTAMAQAFDQIEIEVYTDGD